MGLFDLFKSKNPLEDVLTTLHCISANQWSEAGKRSTPKELIKKSKSSNDDEFLNHIKKSSRYTKLENNFEINEGVSKISCSGNAKGHFVFPTYYLNADVKSDILVQGMRIIKSKVSYDPEDGYKITDGFSLEILNITREDKKTFKPRKSHYVYFQYVDLDKDEYKYIKPLYSKTTNLNKDGLYNNVMELFKGYHYGLGGTEKRKAYPINRYDSYYGFKE